MAPHLPRDLANFNALKKTMSNRYYCINSTIYSPKCTESMALYFVTISQSKDGREFSLTRAKPYIGRINRSAIIVKYSVPERVYSRYSIIGVSKYLPVYNFSLSQWRLRLKNFQRGITR